MGGNNVSVWVKSASSQSALGNEVTDISGRKRTITSSSQTEIGDEVDRNLVYCSLIDEMSHAEHLSSAIRTKPATLSSAPNKKLMETHF